MMRFFTILSLIGIDHAFGEIFYYEFIKDTCNFTYGEPISQKEEINDMICVKSCTQHENCLSLMYEKATRQCFLNAKMQEDKSQFPADCGVQYAAPVVRYHACDESWQYIAGRCYHYVNDFLTWHGCDNYCIRENSYLAKLYNLSTYTILWNATLTSRNTTFIPWIAINDQMLENVYTDHEGVLINPELIPTIHFNFDYNDCGSLMSTYVRMSICDIGLNCLCEKPAIIKTKRPNLRDDQ